MADKLQGRWEETCGWDPAPLQLLIEVLVPSNRLAAILEAWLGLGYVVLGKPAKIVALGKDSFPFSAAFWLRVLAAYLACLVTRSFCEVL